MTDKEIIIDGIDVSKCGHYHYGKCEIDYDEWNNEIIRYNECQNNPNCNYKQLKHKEQECEELKQTLTKIIRFLKEDKKFARYSGYPIVLTSIVIEEIEKILKENDIKINECEANQRKLKDD